MSFFRSDGASETVPWLAPGRRKRRATNDWMQPPMRDGDFTVDYLNFSDDEDESEDEDAPQRAPPRYGRPSESDGPNAEEALVLRAVSDLVAPETREVLERNDLLALRLVRGYWNYSPREKCVATVADDVAALRRRYRSDTLLETRLSPLDFHSAIWPASFCGVDDFGHVVVCEKLGDVSLERAFFNGEVSPFELLRLRVQTLEAIQRECALQSVRQGWRAYKVVFIVDVAGAGLSLLKSQVMQYCRDYAQLTEKLFADAVFCNYVVNAPTSAKYAWRAIGTMLCDETRDLVQFVGGTKEETVKALVQGGVPRAAIPKYLGGLADLRPISQYLQAGYGTTEAPVHRDPVPEAPDRPQRFMYVVPAILVAIAGLLIRWLGTLPALLLLFSGLLIRRLGS
ncbi:CRAL-TRIO domain-containing protein [Pelagophyceae sp. CCMP2097]|nr:CRAL-TRIO domain-containing protein [Pelagophyceae sp. CCMP2097]|mmetsp:Transcript_20/g.79  ORF Transcript_20/g.79 Transcript_20/m.79 type:complete len:398 (+) Transcript_20:81-1274(+)